MPNIRFHDLRATYCTLLLKNNFNIKAISCLMGHSTEIVSVDVYGDKNELVKDCVKEITPFINRVLPNEKKQICDLTNDTEIINITEKMIKHLIE